jgi:hypothetical protein
MRQYPAFPAFLAMLLAAAACRGETSDDPIDAGADAFVFVDAARGPDAADLPDGPPTRRTCTESLGSALDESHGRLDGILVSIVEPGFGDCNADQGHVHLQVEMDGATYDVAVNVDDPENVRYLAADLPLPGLPWTEGWHTGQDGILDYPAMGVHAGDFASLSRDDLTAAIDAELADANHVSIYMTGYGPDGGHNVHRRSTFLDGAIVIRPLSAHPRMLLFHFDDQTF